MHLTCDRSLSGLYALGMWGWYRTRSRGLKGYCVGCPTGCFRQHTYWGAWHRDPSVPITIPITSCPASGRCANDRHAQPLRPARGHPAPSPASARQPWRSGERRCRPKRQWHDDAAFSATRCWCQGPSRAASDAHDTRHAAGARPKPGSRSQPICTWSQPI